MTKVKYKLNDDMCDIQNNDFAIKSLISMVEKQVRASKWREHSLNQFKRHFNDLELQNGLLVRKENNGEVIPVIPFDFLIEVVYQTHSNGTHWITEII